MWRQVIWNTNRKHNHKSGNKCSIYDKNGRKLFENVSQLTKNESQKNVVLIAMKYMTE